MVADGVVEDVLYSMRDVEREFGISPTALLQRACSATEPRVWLCIPSPPSSQIRSADLSSASQEKYPQVPLNSPHRPPMVYAAKYNPIRLLDDPELRCIALVISCEVCNMLRQTRHARETLFEAIYGADDLGAAHAHSGYGLVSPYRKYADVYEQQNSDPSAWRFAVYPMGRLFRVNQDFEGSQPVQFEITPEDVCIIGVELRRYIDEVRRNVPVLSSDRLESTSSVVTLEGVFANKTKPKARRSDLMRLEIAEVHDSLGKKIGELTAHEVMKELKRNAGKSGSCVLKEEQDGVRWGKSSGGTEILLMKNLHDRLSYSKRTAPEQTE